MSDRILNVAIAGFGRSGHNIHGRCLKGMPELFKIVAVADELPERSKDAVENYDARSYDDFREMIKAEAELGEVDVFVNALPSLFRKEGNMLAFEAGFNVVTEKPLARCVADVDEMEAAAKKAGVRFMPFQNNRLQPFFDKIQEVIASGVLGKIVNIRSTWGGFRRRWDWQTLQKNMGGSLFNTGPHAVDQAVILFGEDKAPEVFCRMDSNNTFGGDADDFCSLTLYDPDRERPQIDITITAYHAYPLGDFYNIAGTQGNLAGNSEHLRWQWFDPKEAPDHEFWKPWSKDRQYTREELPWQYDEWTLDPEEQKEAVGYTLRSYPSGPRRFYKNVSDVILDDAEMLITLPQIRRQVAIMEEAHRQNPLPRNED